MNYWGWTGLTHFVQPPEHVLASGHERGSFALPLKHVSWQLCAWQPAIVQPGA